MMKQKLLKTLALGLMVMLGVNAWADDWTLDNESYGRTNLSESTYSWNSGWPKSPSSTNNTFNCNIRKTGMFVLQKYTVNNLAAVKSLTLKLTGPVGNDALAIWAYGKNDPWPTSDNAASVASAVNSIVGVSLNTTTGTVNTPLVNGGSNKQTVDTDYRSCEFTISGDELATLKSTANENTFVILITNQTSEILTSDTERKFFNSGHATTSYRPTLTVTYYPFTVTSGTTVTGYDTFSSALSAAVAEDELTIYQDVQLTGTRIENAVALTIKGGVSGVKFVRGESNTGNMLFLPKANLTLQDLVIDDNNVASTVNMIESSQTGVTLTLQDVTVKNCKTTNYQGAITTKSNGTTVFNNIAFENCKTSSDYGVLFAGNSSVTFTGNNTFDANCTGANLYIQKDKDFRFSSANNTTPITVKLADDYVNHKIANNGSASLFRILNKGWYVIKDGSIFNANYVSASYDLTIGTAGMATLVLPFNVASLPTGAGSGTIKAYKLTTTSSVVKAEEVTSITKDKPVLIVGSADTYTFTGDAAADYSTEAPQNGALIGTYKAIDAADGNYVLQNGASGVGFYQLVESSNHVINPFRAYLSGDANNSARSMRIVFEGGDVTGVEEVQKVQEFKNSEYYDLQGRRVANPTKGIYIKDGKKYIFN